MAPYSSTPPHDALSADEIAQPPPYDQHVSSDLDEHVHLATLEEKKRRWWRNAFINAAFIASWCAVHCIQPNLLHSITLCATAPAFSPRYLFATVLSVYNKWMFSPDYYGFPFPLLVTTMHMFVQFVFSAGLRYGFPRQFRPDRTPSGSDYL